MSISKNQEHSESVVSGSTKFPAIPGEYQPTRLFLQKKRDYNVPGELISEVISTGFLKDMAGYRAKFVKRTGGFLWEFVVEFNSGYKNEVVNIEKSE